jgi:hypothetical protein
MKSDLPTNVWERVMQFEGILSSAAARALLTVRFSQGDVDRMNELGKKARAGSLTPDEQIELDNYEHFGSVLDILHSKARGALTDLELFHESLRQSGLLVSEPEPLTQLPTEPFEPVTITGEPLSSTIIAERR